MIQILGLREYTDPRDEKLKVAEKFFEKNWRAPSVQEILANPDTYLKNIPEDERYNLYFTTAECIEEKGRKLLCQRVIPFDIDGIDKTKIRETWFAACEALGLIPEKNGAVYSGNGIWIFAKSHVDIQEDSFFEAHRLYYKEVCHRITKHLQRKGLPGTADPSVWSPARLARMPNTLNKKKNKEPVRAYTLNPVIEEEFNFITVSGIPLLKKEDQLDHAFMKRYPSPDSREILSDKGCRFLSYCKAEPNKISEQQWYAMLSITEWLPDGRQHSHEYSHKYKGYSVEETNRKGDQAKLNAGPRTCSNISQLWDGCAKCPHFNKVTSPIQIRGEDFVVTEKSGFWSYKTTKDGAIVKNRPEVMDLLKYFKRKHIFISVPENGELYLYNGKYWEEKHTSYLEIYAKEHFDPAVPTHIYAEFKKNVLLTNGVDKDWFHRTTGGKFNLQNGVYDMETGLLTPHDRGMGFTSILPYEYDRAAQAPTFMQYLQEITCGRMEIADTLLEYTGYALSNDPCWIQKAMFLVGDGANGKSTFADVLRAMAGSNNCSSVRIERIGNPVYNVMLEHKLFNISEESSRGAFFDSQDFKEVVAGGHLTIKKLYKGQYEVPNRTKLMILCNELPITADNSHGFLRRILIVPFDRTFLEHERDHGIVQKLCAELAGIFNIVVAKYKQAKERGAVSLNTYSSNTLTKYAHDNDPTSLWISEEFEFNDALPKEKWPLKSDIYQDYSTVCQYDWGVKPLSAVEFWRRFSKVFKRDIRANVYKIRRGDKTSWAVKGLVRKDMEVPIEF